MGPTGNDQKPVPDFGLGTQRLYERMDSCARRAHERQHEPQRTCRLVSQPEHFALHGAVPPDETYWQRGQVGTGLNGGGEGRNTIEIVPVHEEYDTWVGHIWTFLSPAAAVDTRGLVRAYLVINLKYTTGDEWPPELPRPLDRTVSDSLD